MSRTAQAAALRNNYFAEGGEPAARRRNFRVSLIDLVRPDSFWPHPISVEMAFELLRWMVEKGSDPSYATQLKWGKCGVEEMLSGGSVRGFTQIKPIQSLDDLRKRFHYAILSSPESDGQVAWRRDHRIDVNSSLTIKAPVYKAFHAVPQLGFTSEAAVIDQLEDVLTGAHGTEMAVSLNPAHPDLRCFDHIDISVQPRLGFSFFLTYGEPVTEKLRSSWSDLIAHSRPGETFLDTFARARDVFQCLVHGSTQPCDMEDMRPLYKGEFIFDQVEALRAGAPAITGP
ncbi:hypothetical protein [Bosea sp. RAC05]|uniref:hypothetical protein n=1 Tax=Bosea sp. RAC05 TaxID=1842539 RepID=UPI00083D9FFC|nr:hypothetical protein [Bosea sp. RAC05]AOG02919.1 hypothetical protein BSY19_4856 [Bosea sp. RAC05]